MVKPNPLLEGKKFAKNCTTPAHLENRNGLMGEIQAIKRSDFFMN
jgi:hypothetical protein